MIKIFSQHGNYRSRSFLLIGLFLFLTSFAIYAQYSGGDFFYSEEHQSSSDDELILEISRVLKVLAITGYKVRQIDYASEPATREKANAALKGLKKAIQVLPKEYRIVVVGHADRTGYEISEKGTIGNDYYSQKRAEYIYEFLLQNIPHMKNKILMGGLGSISDERMVTFKILPKAEAEKIHNSLSKK